MGDGAEPDYEMKLENVVMPSEQRAAGGLAPKLARIMGKVGWVEKRGENVSQSYKYVTEADVLDAVRPLLAAEGIAVIPEVRDLTFREIHGRDKVIPVATVTMRFTFTDGTDSFVVTTVGEGMDSGDKAVYKAMTGALKYAIRQLVLISTGDDPEKDDKTARGVYGEPKPARRAPVTAEQKDRSDKKGRLLAAFRRGDAKMSGMEMVVWIQQWLDIPEGSPRLIRTSQDLGNDELDVCVEKAEQRWPGRAS